jgi:hypothetical protein
MGYRHLPSPDFHRLDCQHYGLREHEHDDEHLVADLGVSSVERFAALRLCGEKSLCLRSPIFWKA